MQSLFRFLIQKSTLAVVIFSMIFGLVQFSQPVIKQAEAQTGPVVTLQAADGSGCGSQVGSPVTASAGGGWSAWAHDSSSDYTNPDCWQIAMGNGFAGYGQDIRIGIQLSDGTCNVETGSTVYTGWAARDGGGLSSLVGDGNTLDFNCARIIVETQALPSGTTDLGDVQVGIQTMEDSSGNPGCSNPQYSGVQYTAFSGSGGGSSGWASIPGVDDPNCMQVFLGHQVAGTRIANVSYSQNPVNVNAGSSASVTATVTNVGNLNWNPGNATFNFAQFGSDSYVTVNSVTPNPMSSTVSVNGSTQFTISLNVSSSAPSGTRTLYFVMQRNGTSFQTNSNALNVSITAQAPITPTVNLLASVNNNSQQQFNASMNTTDSLKLFWNSQNAGSCTASSSPSMSGSSSSWSGNQPPTSGTNPNPSLLVGSVSSANTYNLTITCYANSNYTGNSAQAQLQLTVNAAAQPTANLSASPASGTAPLTSTLNWSFSNFSGNANCNLSGQNVNTNVGSGSSGSGTTSTGSLSAGNYTYTLNCGGGAVIKTATVSVSSGGGGGGGYFTCSATPASLTLNKGSSGSYSVTLNSVSGYTGSVTLSVSTSTPLSSGVTASASPNPVTIPAFSFASSSFILNASSSAATVSGQPLNIKASDGNVANDAICPVQYSVAGGAISVTLNANPTSVTSGGSSNLTWSYSNTSGCNLTASPAHAGFPLNNVAASGSTSSGSLTATTTFTLSCSGGGSASATVTVSGGGGPTASLTANPTTVTSGSSSNLTWSSTGATSCSINPTPPGWPSTTSGSISTGSISTSRTYSLNCSGAVANATVTVTGGAATASLSANPTSITSGSSSSLTWSSTNAPSCSINPTPPGWTSATSGTISSGSLSSTTTYNLNCGGATASATVTVSGGGGPTFSWACSYGGASSSFAKGSGSTGGALAISSSGSISVTSSVSVSPPATGLTVNVIPPATQTVNPSGQFNFTIVSTASTPNGSYTVTFTGVSGATSHSCTLTYTVGVNFGWFNCAASGATTVAQGGSLGFVVTAGSNDGQTYVITASGAVSAPNSTIAVTSANPQTSPPNHNFTYTMQTAASTTAGNYFVTLTGTTQGVSISCTVNFTVTAAPDYSMACSPASLNVTGGSSGSYTVTLTRINSYAGSVTVSAAITSSVPASAPTPPTFSVSPNPVANPSTTTSLIATTTGSTTPGTYTITISGTDGTLNKTCGSTVQLVVQSAAYTVTPTLNFSATQGGSNPVSQNVVLTNTGNVVLNGITVTPSAGAPWMTVSNAPINLPLNPPSNLPVSISITGLAAGSYSATITFNHSGSPAAGSRQTTVKLTVSSGAPNKPLNSAADNAFQCGSIKVTWQAPASGGNPVQGYYVYRSASPVNPPATGNWGSPIFTKNNTTNPLEYLDTPPVGGPYYYAVSAFSGAFESNKDVPGVTPTALVACQPNLGQSDKDIMEVDGTQVLSIGTPPTLPPVACNGVMDPVLVNGQQPNIGDGTTIKFRICIRNNGNATATGLGAVDTLTNLAYVSPQTVVYAGACAGSGQPSVSGNTLTFSLPNLPVGGADCTITFTAKTVKPSGSQGTLFTFNNKALITATGPAGPVSKTVSTTLLPFGVPPTVPQGSEVAP